MTDTASSAPPGPGSSGPGLSHVRDDGSAHMVDVTGKTSTRRVARAQAILRTRPDVVAQIADGSLPKGEALGTARIAGIMAAKQTSNLIPLCHPLPIGSVTVDFETEGPGVEAGSVRILTAVSTRGVTGVEMEALTAASVAALTLYDMIKAVDKLAVIEGIQVLAKQGGKSGDWVRDGADTEGIA
ncbi:cyclic pyranopterin monophosphate synthase accessory protein [Frondihabitans sp. PAMC 28766]|uniref:cyclic pyranopterin monophosphate synthase MoaC n=1 Tax=Frondihabitans sp. PAMC 28766 TaxID=1795630 RepID=UPI00078D9E7C|nr:cyclic pyranopterin monophosphate synthase MoaC [Frondihabitans sp. PAMC 28766]AMM20146.1 cyclic pyranopterin monophosphate synthase accessory protein [Frondihabitans sp. PAMC 28766]